MENYLDLLNYIDNGNTNNMSGGGFDSGVPSGGFPPFYECIKQDTDKIVKGNGKKKREFSSDQIISIEDILGERRGKIDFIKK
jgi:hypothetical protein